MGHNLHAYFNTALEFINEVGTIIKKKIKEEKQVECKESRVDFVTQTDKEVEKLLIHRLESVFPDHRFIGEESASETNKIELTDKPTWIIDPVDGTMNFVHSNPCVGISVGFYINKEPKIGIIYLPVFDYLFSAIENEGSLLNGQSIRVSKVKELSEALVYIEGGNSRDSEKVKNVKENFDIIYSSAHGFRSSGSAVYNMSMVAMGAADCYIEYGCHAWDMAAGCLIIKEAGGIVMDPSGGPFDVMSRRVICASTENLAKEICGKIKQYYPKRDDDYE